MTRLLRPPRRLHGPEPTRSRPSLRRGRSGRSRIDPALTLELMARELRGGATLPTALRSLAHNAELGLADVVGRIESGGGVAQELDRWCLGLASDDQALVRSVFRLGLTTGAGLASSLERAASTLRERRTLQLELAALSAQSRASALLLAVAPAGFLIVLLLVDPGALAMLFTTPLGWACLVIGGGLDALGFWWMRRLVASVAS